MIANTAASMLTKDIDDLALGEAVQASLILGLIVLAVLLAFGIKTYLHWRRQPEVKERAESAAATPPKVQSGELAPRIDVLSVLGDLRRPGAMKHSFEERK
ncbi:hypothetical protein [Glutamicibacter ardleyensis]|uniref:Uncharacterized protein n=1 Tax=Glutamicibacter ardleyensis TaxID=225894 RepID=A0ABQ2DCA1_9MICC|nr:hypothetical protein [Glutamicibacter ardleyensis]GGJ50726.1 hypothetical protein GCM10007173_06610 [Glutamicibacter ardleyensis]